MYIVKNKQKKIEIVNFSSKKQHQLQTKPQD